MGSGSLWPITSVSMDPCLVGKRGGGGEAFKIRVRMVTRQLGMGLSLVFNYCEHWRVLDIQEVKEGMGSGEGTVRNRKA